MRIEGSKDDVIIRLPQPSLAQFEEQRLGQAFTKNWKRVAALSGSSPEEAGGAGEATNSKGESKSYKWRRTSRKSYETMEALKTLSERLI